MDNLSAELDRLEEEVKKRQHKIDEMLAIAEKNIKKILISNGGIMQRAENSFDRLVPILLSEIDKQVKTIKDYQTLLEEDL